ncbi:MAG: hypothetical protein U1E76_23480 [Planctomycetota bacterium]
MNLDCLVNNELFAAFRRGGGLCKLDNARGRLRRRGPTCNLIAFLGERPALAFYQQHLRALADNPPLYRVVDR